MLYRDLRPFIQQGLAKLIKILRRIVHRADVDLTTTSLDPIHLAPWPEALTRYTAYPKPAIYGVKLESRLITEDNMLPLGHCQVAPPLRPLQAEMMVVGSQQGLRCGSNCPVTTGQESVVNHCATSPHSVQISHPRCQGPSTQEKILSDHPQQCTVLQRCCLSGNP